MLFASHGRILNIIRNKIELFKRFEVNFEANVFTLLALDHNHDFIANASPRHLLSPVQQHHRPHEKDQALSSLSQATVPLTERLQSFSSINDNYHCDYHYRFTFTSPPLQQHQLLFTNDQTAMALILHLPHMAHKPSALLHHPTIKVDG